jgi:hypothetical protein
MCGPLDTRLLFLFTATATVAIATLYRRTRAIAIDQRGFTLAEMGGWLLVAAAVITVAYVLLTHCYTAGAAAFGTASPLPPGAIQKGAAAPAGTRGASCEIGDVCSARGKDCGGGLKCGETYSWDPSVAQWRCDCECR